MPILDRRALLITLGGAIAAACQQQRLEPDTSEAARINALTADWVDVRRQCLGVAVGLVDHNERTAFAHGVLGLSDPRPVTGDTVFGIASLTKVFTGLLLSDAIQRGEMRLDDPLRAHLPATVTLPTRDGREIRLVDIALHTTGFPQEIPDYEAAAARADADPNKPLFDFLASFQLPRPIGESWSYSNLNYALLGIALAHRAGQSYDTLIRSRIAEPLRMSRTGVALTARIRFTRASPHIDMTTPAPEWNKPWSLGAGALQSTANDLARFLAAACGAERTSLASAFDAMLATRIPAPFLGGEQAIGWGIDLSSGDPRIFFGGRAPGFTSSMMFDPKANRGVAALCNSSLMVEALGREILRPGSTAEQPQQAAPAPAVPALDRLVGRYVISEDMRDARFAAGDIVAVTRIQDGIAVELPRYPIAPLKATGPREFQIEGFPVRLDFPEGANAAPALMLTVAGQTSRATRE